MYFNFHVIAIITIAITVSIVISIILIRTVIK